MRTSAKIICDCGRPLGMDEGWYDKCSYCRKQISIFKMKQPVMLSVKDYMLLKSFIPNWAKNVPKGLDPTMYGTGSYEGDKKVMNRLKELHKRLFPGDFIEEDFDVYYPEDE